MAHYYLRSTYTVQSIHIYIANLLVRIGSVHPIQTNEKRCIHGVTGAQDTPSARLSPEQKLRLCGTAARHPATSHTAFGEPLQLLPNQAHNVLHNQALETAPQTNCSILKSPWLPWQHLYYVTREQAYCYLQKRLICSKTTTQWKGSKAEKHVTLRAFTWTI